MPNIAYRIAHERVLAVEKLVEEWQIDHEEAKFVCEVEDLVRETSDLLVALKRLTRLPTNRAVESDPSEIMFAHMIGLLLGKALSLFPRVMDLVTDAHHVGYSVVGLDDFNSASSELAALRDDFNKRWLLPDEKTVAKAKLQLASGKFRQL